MEQIIVPTWIPTVMATAAMMLASGLVGWVWALWREHHALRLKLAEEYPSHTTFRELKDEVGKLRDVVYRIADRLEVPVIRRD
jgi:hypothetical protein